MKECGNCFRFLSLDDFSTCGTNDNGKIKYRPNCKDCTSEINLISTFEKLLKTSPNLYWRCEKCDKIQHICHVACIECKEVKEVEYTKVSKAINEYLKKEFS